MRDYAAILGDQVRDFGNHHRKYVNAVMKYAQPLLDALESQRKRTLVHMLHPGYDFPNELKTVASVAGNDRERLNFIGTYFALHYLFMNRQAIDQLRMDVITGEHNRYQIYRNFMLSVGDRFRTLTASYIGEMLNVLLPEAARPEFVIMGVGTRSDQDDIDIGIVDDGTPRRADLNRAVARISQEMFKFATSFHFHLSEHIGRECYSASIPEYQETLRREIGDFVIISEMLSAAAIVGSQRLFARYRADVIARFFFTPGAENRYHEGYLRGILGEVSSLLARPIATDHINFKEDGLRAIKSIVTAEKTIHNTRQVNAWQIIDDLCAFNPVREGYYRKLERSLTFFEIVRYLYQVFVAQDEEVMLDETALQNLRRVARVLGYHDIGRCTAEVHLLTHYYEHVEAVRATIPLLSEDIKSHLHATSVFVPMFAADFTGNLPLAFNQQRAFFKTVSFWDDILENFRDDQVVQHFIHDLDGLDAGSRQSVIDGLAGWAAYDIHSLMKLLTTMGTSKPGLPLFRNLSGRLLKLTSNHPEVLRDIAGVYFRFPILVKDYFELCETPLLEGFLEQFEQRVFEDDVARIVADLKQLLRIYTAASPYLRRYVIVSLRRYPDAIEMIGRPALLREFGDAIYSDVATMPDFSTKKAKLGDYYTFQTMRIGVDVLLGAGCLVHDEFTETADRYLQTLYDICRQEIDAQYERRMLRDDVLAVFAAGGYARRQAFEDDFDLIALLDSDDPELLAYSNRVISRMNAAMIHCGMIPHHRFADHAGTYVIPLKTITTFLDTEHEGHFIEQSQLLGARLIIGSGRFAHIFRKTILEPHVLLRRDAYIAQMRAEMRSRHQRTPTGETIDIKESPGGIRDIDMVMLMTAARLGVTGTDDGTVIDAIEREGFISSADLTAIRTARDLLGRLRTIHRLTIGATDDVAPETLSPTAVRLGYATGMDLYRSLARALQECSGAIERVIARLSPGERP